MNRWTQKILKAVFLIVVFAGLVLYCCGCSPVYVLRSAYEEAKILANREDISELVANQDTPAEEKEKLKIVVASREFAATIGLKPQNSFTKYSRIDRPELAWVLMGSEKTDFKLKTWWYPIVGSVPYHGYFEQADARDAAAKLEQEGFETWVRPTDAFSTLGWFNDPVLSTTLRRNVVEIANTVIHEIVHSTVWVPDHVDFNESSANFVATQAAPQFWSSELSRCTDEACRTQMTDSLKLAEKEFESEILLASIITQLFDALDSLYKSDKTQDLKLNERVQVFEARIAPFKAAYPKARILRSINNAEILQLKIYLSKFGCFRALYEESNADWGKFFEKIVQIKERTEDDAKPFEVLQQMVGTPC